jgi:hypothetical protein
LLAHETNAVVQSATQAISIRRYRAALKSGESDMRLVNSVHKRYVSNQILPKTAEARILQSQNSDEQSSISPTPSTTSPHTHGSTHTDMALAEHDDQRSDSGPTEDSIHLAVAGERSLVKVKLTKAGAEAQSNGRLHAHQFDGTPLPAWLHAEFAPQPGHTGEIWLRGTPMTTDIGILHIVIYELDGLVCVGKTALEVVSPR